MTRVATGTRTYDDLARPELDMSRWFYLAPPPELSAAQWTCREPNARTEVAGGRLSVHIERFEKEHHQAQMLDNPKHLLLSTESFAVPPTGRVSVAMEMAATSINATPRDYRDGFATLNVIDPSAGWVFDLCATSDMIFSIYERLPVPGVEHPFSYVVDEPAAGLDIASGRAHHYQVTLDAGRGAAEWRVDGHLVFDARDIEIPAEVKIGMGIITLHPIVEGRSRSVRGQGLAASFGPMSVSVSD